MGRTIASITQTWHEEESALKRFERALRREDQILLDELLTLSRLHLAEASYASNLYPLDMYLIAILVEVYKQLKNLQAQVRAVRGDADPKTILELDKQAHFLDLLSMTITSVSSEPLELHTTHSEISLEQPSEPTTALSYSAFEDAP